MRFNALMQSYGLPVQLTPQKRANPSGEKCPSLSNLPLEEAYWPSTREIMRRVYQQDFLHLGDSMPQGHAVGDVLEKEGPEIDDADAVAQHVDMAVARAQQQRQEKDEERKPKEKARRGIRPGRWPRW